MERAWSSGRMAVSEERTTVPTLSVTSDGRVLLSGRSHRDSTSRHRLPTPTHRPTTVEWDILLHVVEALSRDFVILSECEG